MCIHSLEEAEKNTRLVDGYISDLNGDKSTLNGIISYIGNVSSSYNKMSDLAKAYVVNGKPIDYIGGDTLENQSQSLKSFASELESAVKTIETGIKTLEDKKKEIDKHKNDECDSCRRTREANEAAAKAAASNSTTN